MEGNCLKRYTPTRHQRSHLTPRYKSEGTYTLFGSIALRTSGFAVVFVLHSALKKGKKKIHLAAEAEPSKSECSTSVFQKTIHLRKPRSHTVKVLESSPLTKVQDLLFQLASSKGTSQQGSRTQPDDGVCPSGSIGMEEVDVELPRTA